jgi:hypothetical protein
VRRLPLACLATVAVADWVIEHVELPWLAIGLFDEPAHLATGYLLGGADPVFLAGSVLPDLDHVPLVFRGPSKGDPRPRTHSLFAALAAGAVSRRLGAGVLAHFARDLALDPGVPLFAGRAFRVPYGAYAVLMLISAYSRSRPC